MIEMKIRDVEILSLLNRLSNESTKCLELDQE